MTNIHGYNNPQAGAAISATAPLAQSMTANTTPRAGKPDFVRPEHKSLVPGRIKDAGPTPHPDPNFRPYGPNQWTDILHDHTLLRFISKNEIGDIKKHCEKLTKADQGPNSTPVLIDNGPYDTSDARVVWKYCSVYIKRRDQLRNNVSAKKSRSRKDNEVKHWKAIAIAAGAPDKPFCFQEDDPAYDPVCERQGVLPEETQEAILAMINTWRWGPYRNGGDGSAGGPSGQLPLPAIPNAPSTAASQADVTGAQSLASASASPEFASTELLQGQLSPSAVEGGASATFDNSPQLSSPDQVFSPALQPPPDFPPAQTQGHGHLQAQSQHDQTMASTRVYQRAPLPRESAAVEACSVLTNSSCATGPSKANVGKAHKAVLASDTVDHGFSPLPDALAALQNFSWCSNYRSGDQQAP